VPTLDVWFDDIEVVHTEALIVQENHYDPYGLSLSGIEKENKPEDKWKFQDKELITELDLNWQDFGARFYDPQLGRWHCVDPADQFSSSYVGLGNNPVTAVDPDGRLAFLPILIGAAIGGVFNLAIKASQGQIGSFKDGLVAFGIGAAGGAVTAATGGAVAGVLGLPATGAISGAVTGAAGSAVGGPVTGIGNAVYFGDSYSSKDWGTGIVTGGVIGGATGGVAALIKGNNFWTGAPRGINPITGSKSNPFSFKNGDYLEENGWQRLSIGKWARGWSEDPDITDVYLGSKRLSRFAGVDYPDPRGNTGGWGATNGGSSLVNLTEETFSQALFNGAENVGGYSIYGTKGLVGSTFNRNIFLLEASGGKSLGGFRSFVGSLEAEALGAGANKISIYGSSVINKGFLNPNIATRFGYTFERSGSGVILQKVLNYRYELKR
jgi:RHS repeat-associated protein